MKKEQPFAICTRCGKTTTNPSLIKERCPLVFRKHGGSKTRPERCKGVYRSMLLPNDWEMCSACNGEGNDCNICRGAGWLSTRRI